MDKEVLKGVTPLEGMPTIPVEESQPPSETATPVIAPKESTAKETPQELVKERKCPKFLDGKRCCTHPSWCQLLDSPLTLQEAWSGLIHLWPTATSL